MGFRTLLINKNTNNQIDRFFIWQRSFIVDVFALRPLFHILALLMDLLISQLTELYINGFVFILQLLNIRKNDIQIFAYIFATIANICFEQRKKFILPYSTFIKHWNILLIPGERVVAACIVVDGISVVVTAKTNKKCNAWAVWRPINV